MVLRYHDVVDPAWSERIKRLRGVLKGEDGKKLSQGELAEKFELSQSQWSRIESGKQQPPEKVRDWIAKEERALGIEARALVDRGGQRSPHFSYTAATFRRLRDESVKHAKSLRLDAEITLNTQDPRYADTLLTLTFEELTVPTGDPLYLDCLGILPTVGPAKSSPNKLEFEKTSEMSLGKWQAERARVEEDPRAKKHIGPHAILYKILSCDKYDNLIIPIIAKKSVRIDDIDAAGLPVYSDCPVESISISVKFNKLLPSKPPLAQAYLLRRTLTESRPVYLAEELEQRIHKNNHTYSIDNLLYPKAGYGYCIAWPSLVRA